MLDTESDSLNQNFLSSYDEYNDEVKSSKEVLRGFKATIKRNSVLSSNRFQSQLSHHFSRMAERLGISIISEVSDQQDDHIAFLLEGYNVNTETIIPLTNSEGHHYSELSLQAASGIISIHGRNSNTLEPLGIDYATVTVAVNALTGLLSQAYALLQCEKDNKKTQVSQFQPLKKQYCSPLGSVLINTSQYIADATSEKAFPLPDNFNNFTLQPPFCSADYIDFELESLNPEPWRQFWRALEIDDRISGQGWKAFQMRYAKAVSPLPKKMVERLGEMPYKDIKSLCESNGIFIVPVSTLSQYSQCSHCKKIWKEGPWHFASHLKTNSNKRKKENKNINKPFDNTKSNYLPLAGVKVVESCRRIQGPLATHILSLLGADVVRIEPPGGDPLRGMPPVAQGCSVRFDAINKNKDVIEINIKESEGKQKVIDLVSNSDVFIHNWAPGKAIELGLDFITLLSSNPDLIYSYASGWSNTITQQKNDFKDLPGTDFTVQAASGLASIIAINQRKKEARGGSLFTVLDTLGGALSAQGVVIGLLSRAINRSTHYYIETSLLGASNLLCDAYLSNIYLDHAPLKESYLDSIFETKTELIAVSLPLLDKCPDLAQLLSIPIAPDFSPSANIQRLNILIQSFKQRSANEWLHVLAKLNVSAAIVNTDLSTISKQALTQEHLYKTHYDTVNSPWRFL